MKILYVVLASVSIALLSGCAHRDTPEAGVYTVSEVQGEPTPATPVITVTYEDGRLIGNGPINRWNVPVLEDGKLGIGISTRMAGAPELMTLETKLLQALDGGRLKKQPSGGIVIIKDGKSVITMQPASSKTSAE